VRTDGGGVAIPVSCVPDIENGPWRSPEDIGGGGGTIDPRADVDEDDDNSIGGLRDADRPKDTAVIEDAIDGELTAGADELDGCCPAEWSPDEDEPECCCCCC
jgi:hypothetical protein